MEAAASNMAYALHSLWILLNKTLTSLPPRLSSSMLRWGVTSFRVAGQSWSSSPFQCERGVEAFAD
jgi:hypothetical protein